MQDGGRDPKIILHIGMQKTATTFLQWNVFHYLDVNYLWHFFYKPFLKGFLDFKKKVDLEKTKRIMPSYLEEEKINLISEENLYTSMFSKEDDRFIMLDRVKTVFPNAKIIFGTREKEEILPSWYKEYVAVGGVLSYDEFLDSHMNLEKLDYKPYIDELKKHYGNENVFVYSLDDIKRDQDEVIKKMCEFMEVEAPKSYRETPSRVGYQPFMIKISLFLNKLFKTPLNDKGLIPWWGPVLPHNILFHSFLFRKRPRKKLKHYEKEKMDVNKKKDK
jgi:hypothetical protein